MKIYDISQEVFSCTVFPGDPSPIGDKQLLIANGDVCNLTNISMCAHNGTHVDAPYHFIDGEDTIDKVPLDKFVGKAFVTHNDGIVTDKIAREILSKATSLGEEYAQRILIGGKATVSADAAKVFVNARIKLIGNESQTVGPEDAPKEVHLILLGAKVVLLEGIRLSGVTEGGYLLCAQPINLGGSDGAPCRAILIEEN